MFNILMAESPIPDSFNIHIENRNNLKTQIRILRKKYIKSGWNILTLGDKIGFLAIDKEQINSLPPNLEDCWNQECKFKTDLFKWKNSTEYQNQFIHSLFTTLKYNLLKKLVNNKFTTAKEKGLRFRRDFLKTDPIFESSYYKVFEGLQFIPSLINKNNNLFPSFIVHRIIRIKGSVKGNPYEIQNFSKINTNNYFARVENLLNEIMSSRLECFLGDVKLTFANQIQTLKLKLISELKRKNKVSDDKIKEYDEDFPFPEELEDEFEDIVAEENIELTEKELIEYIFPILPSRIEYGILEEPSLWVGKNEKKSKFATMYLLNQFGPIYSPDCKIIFIPLYPENQPEIKDKILRVSQSIISGSGSGFYDFPGLINRFNLKISLTNPKSIPLNLSNQDFERSIAQLLEDLRNEHPNLPIKFKLNENLIPFFIIGFSENAQREWGKFTPLYQYFKENLVRLGYPNQIIKKFNAFFGQYKSFPLWSVSNSIFAKIGGIPWQIEANYARNGDPIDAIIGYRFARQSSENGNGKYILGIATVFSGNGRYLGFKVKNVEINDIEENYRFIFKSHGYTRRYEGLKIPSEDIKNLFFDSVRLIDNRNYHQDKPGAIVVHRLGSVSTEEADGFLDCFKSSKFSAGALVSISQFPLRWKFNNNTISRGTWVNIDQKSGLLFPQGISEYYQGKYSKRYSPKSVPKSFKIAILRDNGVYAKPHDAGYDIISLSRMNWRHLTYIPSNYPISLQYALIIAQNIKNNILPTGDLNETPWFL